MHRTPWHVPCPWAAGAEGGRDARMPVAGAYGVPAEVTASRGPAPVRTAGFAMPPGVAHSLLGVPVLRTWGTRAWFRRPMVIVALTVLTGSVGACAAGDTPPAAPPAGTPASASPAPQPEFCGAVIDLLQVLEVGPDISSTSTPQDVATALQAFGAQVEPPGHVGKSHARPDPARR